jgi:hypothetical protein
MLNEFNDFPDWFARRHPNRLGNLLPRLLRPFLGLVLGSLYAVVFWWSWYRWGPLDQKAAILRMIRNPCFPLGLFLLYLSFLTTDFLQYRIEKSGNVLPVSRFGASKVHECYRNLFGTDRYYWTYRWLSIVAMFVFVVGGVIFVFVQ